MMLNCPQFERPREKAIYNGIETLSNQELIAVILRTGNKEMSVLNLASLLLEEIGGSSFKRCRLLSINEDQRY